MHDRPRHALVAFYNRRHHPAIVRWLRRTTDCRVTTLLLELGESLNVEAIRTECRRVGSDEVVFIDGRDEFCTSFLASAVKANALYEGVYRLSAALARPMLAGVLVREAQRIGADVVVHGFRGNDQVRVDMGVAALAGPRCLAALREWDVTDADVADICEELGIPQVFGTGNPYSISENLWGGSVECGGLSDPAVPAPPDARLRSSDKALPAPRDIEIAFQRGVPVSLDGQELPFAALLERMNALGADYGVGRVDAVENGLVGMKSRAVYEAPGAMLIGLAHADLERLVLNRHEARLKSMVEPMWGWMVYDGLWFDPARTHLEALLESASQRVTGRVRLRLDVGSAAVVARESPYGLFHEDLAIYGFGHLHGREDAAAFGRVFGLHTAVTRRVIGSRK